MRSNTLKRNSFIMLLRSVAALYVGATVGKTNVIVRELGRSEKNSLKGSTAFMTPAAFSESSVVMVNVTMDISATGVISKDAYLGETTHQLLLKELVLTFNSSCAKSAKVVLGALGDCFKGSTLVIAKSDATFAVRVFIVFCHIKLVCKGDAMSGWRWLCCMVQPENNQCLYHNTYKSNCLQPSLLNPCALRTHTGALQHAASLLRTRSANWPPYASSLLGFGTGAS